MRLIVFVIIFCIVGCLSCNETEKADPVIGRWLLVDEITTENGVDTRTYDNYEDCLKDDVYRIFKKNGIYYLSIDPSDLKCDSDPEEYEYGDIGVFINAETNAIQSINMPIYVNLPLHPVIYGNPLGIITSPFFTVEEVNATEMELGALSGASCQLVLCRRTLKFSRQN